ncbi:MAG: hypothetical protein IPI79_08850, partial [Moraxellaceae bacterium]|nr:hypothetical protein [Moraxellaceae bacterium]
MLLKRPYFGFTYYSAFAWACNNNGRILLNIIEPCGVVFLTQLEQRLRTQTHHATPRLQKLSLLLQQEIIPEWQAHLAKHSAEQVVMTVYHHQQQLQPFLYTTCAQQRVISVNERP